MSNAWRKAAKKISHSKTTGKKLTVLEKVVLTSLADFHNDKYDQCYPSHETIAKDINSTRETVARNVKKLVEHGLISVSNRGSGQNSKLVKFLFPKKETIPNSIVTQNHNEVDSIVTQSHSHCDSKAIHCDSKAFHCDAESHEQVITINNNHTTEANSETDAISYLQTWLCVYPEKGNRKAIVREWNRLKPAADVLIADTENRKQNDRRWLAGYIPKPENYLKDERYNEPIEPVRKSESETTLPRDDNKLEDWAVAHGIHQKGNAPLGMDYAEYRQWLQKISQRPEFQP